MYCRSHNAKGAKVNQTRRAELDVTNFAPMTDRGEKV